MLKVVACKMKTFKDITVTFLSEFEERKTLFLMVANGPHLRSLLSCVICYTTCQESSACMK